MSSISDREGDDDYVFDIIIAETDKAWLISIDDTEMWFPKSCCSINYGKKIITIPQWLAEQKGLI